MRKTRLDLDALDNRVMPSASLVNGVLLIDGTDGPDTVVVRQASGKISVRGQKIDVDGVLVSAVRAADVSRVSVATGLGSDIVNLSSLRIPATVDAGGGDDVVTGGAGADVIDGGAGKDRLSGGGGADVLRGGNGDDVLNGGNGDDQLAGEDGNDRVNGQYGDDDNDGGAGDDRVIGGPGRDRNVGGGGADVVSDVNARRHAGDAGHHPVAGVITAIDLDTSTVTIQAESGELVTVTAGPDTVVSKGGDHATLAALAAGDWAVVTFDAAGGAVLIAARPREGHGEHDRVEGVITAIDVAASRVTLRTHAGTFADVTVGPDATVTRNGERTTLAAFQVGDWAAAAVGPDGVAVAITAQTHVEHTGVEGDITAINLDTARVTIQGHDGAPVEVTVGPDTVLIRNREHVTLAAFRVGDRAHASVDSQGVALVLAAESHAEPTHVEGGVTAINLDASRVTIQTPNGAMIDVTVGPDTTLIRNGQPATLADFQVGDRARATVGDHGVALELAAESHVEPTHVEGGITAINLDTSRVTIQTPNGALVEVAVSPATTLIRNGQPATLADFRIGDRARATVGDHGVALELAAEEHHEPTSVEGVITAIGEHATRVTIQTESGTAVTVTVDFHTEIFRNGGHTGPGDLRQGDHVVALADDGGHALRIEATSV